MSHTEKLGECYQALVESMAGCVWVVLKQAYILCQLSACRMEQMLLCFLCPCSTFKRHVLCYDQNAVDHVNGVEVQVVSRRMDPTVLQGFSRDSMMVVLSDFAEIGPLC